MNRSFGVGVGRPTTVDDPVFLHGFEVGDDDIDLLGHASNIAYIRWVQDVAVMHSNSMGLDYEAYVKLGAVFIVRRHEIDYLRPALRGDRLQLRTWVGTVHAAKCERHTEFRREGDETLLARALTIWGFVDTQTGRPTRIPDLVRSAFHQPLLKARRGGRADR